LRGNKTSFDYRLQEFPIPSDFSLICNLICNRSRRLPMG